MKLFLSLFSLIIAFNCNAQTVDTIKYIINDTLGYYNVVKNDTIFGYNYKGELYWMRVYNNENTYTYRVKDGKITLSWAEIITHSNTIIKDNRCNGIKTDGTRCTRSVDNSKSSYYCWQHKP